jgi:hypothetical protein
MTGTYCILYLGNLTLPGYCFEGDRVCCGKGGLRSTHVLRQIRIAEQATVT